MSFLNKYKQGGSGAAPADGVDNFRKSANVAKSFDEDDMDISLSSDSDIAARNPAQKSPSRLKARRDNPVLKAQTGKITAPEGGSPSRSLTLTEMRSSAHFATAKELGISGPKAAVSPVGLQGNRSTNRGGGGARYQADVSPPEQQSSSLRLAVSIPGESSTYGSLVRQGSDSDVESVGSAVAEALEEQIREKGEASEEEPWLGSLNSEPSSSSEVDAGGSSSLVSPTFEQQNGSGSGRRFARSPPDHRGALGKITSLDDLPTGSPLQIPSILGDREGRAVGEGGDDESSASRSCGENSAEGSEAEGDDDEEEDDYGDDDFEDQDVLTESNGEKPGGQRLASEKTFAAGGHNGNPACTALETATVSSQPCGGQIPSSAGQVILEQPREAWNAPPADEEKTRLMPTTSESGTSPGSPVNRNTGRKDCAVPDDRLHLDERAPSVKKEAWGERSPIGSYARGDGNTTSVRKEGMEGGVSRSFIPTAGQCQQSSIGCRTTKEGGSEGSVSKGGVLIDRSTEASEPSRPPDTKVKVLVRAETVASLEYTHDQERGLDLRSCGTQV